jgi:site-specific recombinase XerD
MATTGARFSEIVQFSLNATDPSKDESTWEFLVKIKNREYLQPVEIHRMENIKVNTIAALKELRNRIRKKRKKEHKVEDTFWYDKNWNVMTRTGISEAAKQLLQDAGIDDDRPYHIKHAAVTWLSKQKTPPDWIVRFLRHKQSSTVYVDYYLSNDMGATCTKTIEQTVLGDDATSNSASVLQDEEEETMQKESLKKRKIRRRSI